MLKVFGKFIERGMASWLVLALAAVIGGCGGSRSASGTDVEVTAAGPAGTLAPGATALFTMTVRNIGTNPAVDVRIVDQLGSFLVQSAFTCEASGGAVCPDSLGAVMTVPTLPVNGALTFRISATVNVISNGTISNTMTATAAEDIGRINNSATATGSVVVASASSLGIAQDTAATVAAGTSAQFKVVVSNPVGATVVNNAVVQWAATAGFALDGISYTCSATGGAECPAAQTPAAAMSFNVATIGAARTLTFIFTVPIPAAARGTVTSTASVSAEGDADLSNNTSTISTVAADTRNGSYTAYAADGRQYTLDIDFDAGHYTMAGNGSSSTRTFTADATQGYTVSGDQRLRSAQDLVVGAHSFDGKLLPYIAARRFGTAIGLLGGAYNLMSRSVSSTGVATTRAATARVSGNVMQVCNDDFEVTQAQACSVGALRSYLLAIDGETITATDSSNGGSSFSFKLARSGAADLLVGVNGAADGSRQLLIGVAESAGLIDSTVYGAGIYASGTTEWLRVDLTRSTYSAGGTVIHDVAGLYRPELLDGLAPVAMLQGLPTPTLAGAPIWVMQSYPLVVVVGAPLSEANQANVSGLLQIGVP